MMFSLEGYGAMVTGGASGIGLAIVEVLTEHGARVTMLDMNADRLEREAARLKQAGYDVHGVQADVSDRAAVDACFAEAAQRYGRLDVVFANAGLDSGPGFIDRLNPGRRPAEYAIENYTGERWNRIIDVCLNGVMYCIGAAARHMKPRQSGRIIVTTSTAAVRPAPAVGAAYMTAKAGAAHLVRNVALELARYNILVNAIAPGPFITNIGGGHSQKPDVQAAFATRIPLKRMAQTEEIKGLALLLASPASSFITGQQIVIDGGYTLGVAD